MSIAVRETEWVHLTQLGLGKALDATNPHPWSSKSSYQAKEVSLKGDIHVHVHVFISEGVMYSIRLSWGLKICYLTACRYKYAIWSSQMKANVSSTMLK